MKIQTFLEHHGIAANPFADEDAQTDLVFKGTCIREVFHPAWRKIYGDPTEPATAVVFGEKGSGKTALRMQMVYHLTAYNADHPDHQVFAVLYDDFNPFLDRFRDRFLRRPRAAQLLKRWRLWDHVDALLSVAVTQLVDRMLRNEHARHPAARDEPLPVESLGRPQARDVLLLAACYDQSTAENLLDRWRRLRRLLGFRTWRSKWDMAVGVAATLAALAGIAAWGEWRWLLSPWPYVAVTAGWLPRLCRCVRWYWRAWRLAQNTRTLNRNPNLLRKILMSFPPGQLVGQPLPMLPRTDDRYEMLGKLQDVLRSLRFDGILVLVDRVDEPYLVNGSTELMKSLVWPMLDNKLLKHQGMGVKLLLPSELERLIDREDRDFHQRARLDKQNLVRSLDWTGQSLYDVANARIAACATADRRPSLMHLLDDAIDQRRVIDAFASLRVPRGMFKFMYRLLTTHSNAYSDENPVWKIPSGTFESVLALYQRDQQASDRGEGAG
jgi:hypothetical protein